MKSKLKMMTTASQFRKVSKFGRRYRVGNWCTMTQSTEAGFLSFKDSMKGAQPAPILLGITIPGRVAGSVHRNQLKRWIKAWVRAKVSDFDLAPPGHQVLVHFSVRNNPLLRKEADRMSFQQFQSEAEVAWGQMAEALLRLSQVSAGTTNLIKPVQ